MGKNSANNTLLALVWYFKVFVAFCIAVGGLGALSYNTFRLYHVETAKSENISVPITINPSSPQCQANNAKLGRVEPPDGTIYVGFHLDWSVQTPVQASAIISKNPAVINSFLDLDDNANPPMDWNMLRWQGSEVQKVGAILELTLQPNEGIANVSDATLTQIAQECKAINEKGIPILLRYGHEMNGDWCSYCLKPVNYVTGFRRLSTIMKRYTNMTAMVWSPNIGINYPFRGGGQTYPTNRTDPVNFQALDTNKDGVIDWKDDPYGPYYPGDDYVDWFGMSLYWYADAGYNGPVYPTYFVDNMLGTGPAIQEFNPIVLGDGGLRNFYGRFPEATNKPLIIPETAAPWFESNVVVASQTETQIKQAWWNQIYSDATRARFPHLKAVVHFEERKADADGVMRDYRILNNPTTAAAYRNDVTNSKTLLFAQQLRYDCGGQVQLK